MNNIKDIWYEVYEDDERGSNQEQTIAFCKLNYVAVNVARLFPLSKIRKIIASFEALGENEECPRL